MNDQTPNLSGIEHLRHAIATGHSSAMADTFGMRLIAVGDGTATFEAHPSEKFYNPHHRVHGGFAATLIDSAMGCAVQTRLPAGMQYGTIEMKVSYVRKIEVASGRLLCTAAVLHSGRTMFTADAKLTGGDGKLYAHGSGTFLVYPK